MRKTRALLVRILNLFRQERGDREFAEELESHLQMHIDDGVRSGLRPEEARRRALIKLGGVEVTRERYRDRRSLAWLTASFRDVAYAVRMMRRNPGLSTTVILTLALGIGATTAIFTVVNAVLLRSLPYPDPDRLVYISHDLGRGRPTPFTYTFDYASYRKNARTISQLGAYQWFRANLTGTGEAERVAGMRATESLFSLLGIRPALGRAFLPEEDRPGGPLVAVVSHPFWMSHFAGSPSVIGKSLNLDAVNYTIVGVLPEGFLIPDQYGRDIAYDVWTPFAISDTGKASGGEIMLQAVARLRPEVTVEAARAELDTLIRQRLRTGRRNHAVLQRWHDEIARGGRRSLMLFSIAVVFVLLVACVNVANLLLARAAARAKEMAMRRALGAARSRVLRQLLTENLLLSIAGGLIGMLFAYWGKGLLVAFLAPNLPTMDPIRLDHRVLAFNACLALITSLVFGLTPALQGSGARMGEFLKDAGRGLTESLASRRLRSGLVVFEVALAMLLLTGAGLLFRSFVRLRGIDPGFRSERILTFNVSLTPSLYPDPRAQSHFVEQALQRMQRLPGVESAAVGAGLPLTSLSWGLNGIAIEGQPEIRADISYAAASAEYFRAMNVPLVEGRLFSESDRAGAPTVTLVNQAFVRRFMQDRSAVGRRIANPGRKGDWMTIVGVIGDVRPDPEREIEPQIFESYFQDPQPHTTFVIRTRPEPMRLAQAVRSELAAVDRTQPPFGMGTLEQARSNLFLPRRVNLLVIVAFAAMALILGSIGIYGVTAYSVGRRTQEIGVRIALGAQQREILAMVLRKGLALIATGVALGLAAGFAVMRLLASQLWGISAHDPWTLASVAAILTASGLAACSLPARRAARVDPNVALRYE